MVQVQGLRMRRTTMVSGAGTLMWRDRERAGKVASVQLEGPISFPRASISFLLDLPVLSNMQNSPFPCTCVPMQWKWRALEGVH